jgi:uncharacterized membrane protein
MAFQFAYTLDGEAASPVKDFALDTAANYGTGGVKKGDLVFLSGGLVRKVQAATVANSGLGVIEGQEFLGLVAPGQPYAATNTSFTAQAINTTKNPNGVGKVRADKSSVVYKVPVKSGQTAATANVGTAYGIALDGNNDQSVDLTVTATAQAKVIDYTTDGKFVYVTLT